MAYVGWTIGTGGVPIPISSIAPNTYGKKDRTGASAKSRPALATIFPLTDVHRHEPQNPIKQKNQRQQLQRALTPLLVPKRVNAPESADCIVLISSDGNNFRVSRSLLAHASPIFHRLFSGMKTQSFDMDSSPPSRSSVISDVDTLCLSHETLADGTLVVQMQETGKTLDALLRYLHPYKPSPSGLLIEQTCRTCVDEIKPVLLTVHKYSIQPILDEICGRLLSDLALPPSNERIDPFALRVYSLACLVKRKSLAEAAAYATLRVRTTGVSFPELEEIPAIHYFRLLDYHQRCASVVSCLLENKELPDVEDDSKGEKPGTRTNTCAKCQNTSRISFSKAFWKYFRSEVSDVIRESPRSRRTLAPEFIIEAFPYISRCGRCREMVLADWRVQSVVLKDQIERCLHKVELDLAFLDEDSPPPPSTDKNKSGAINLFHKFATIR